MMDPFELGHISHLMNGNRMSNMVNQEPHKEHYMKESTMRDTLQFLWLSDSLGYQVSDIWKSGYQAGYQ